MSRPVNVYSIGNAIVDLQLQVSEESFTELGLEKGSMNLIDAEQQEALLGRLDSGQLHKASGGSAANSMIAVAQLGGSAAYGCLVGEDDFGSFYTTEMAELGITLYTNPAQGGSTGSSVILITPDAERTMNTCLGVSAEFGPEHISSRIMKDAEWLFVEGYLFSTPKGQEAVRKAISVAGKCGTKVAVTVSDAFIVDVFGDPLREALKYADLVFANLTEAEKYVGEGEDVVERFQSEFPNSVVTRGSAGAVVRYGGERAEIAPIPTTAIDDTGAGDMFAGSFLYGITNGYSGEQAGNLASNLASRVVSKLGPRLEKEQLGDLESVLRRA